MLLLLFLVFLLLLKVYCIITWLLRKIKKKTVTSLFLFQAIYIKLEKKILYVFLSLSLIRKKYMTLQIYTTRLNLLIRIRY